MEKVEPVGGRLAGLGLSTLLPSLGGSIAQVALPAMAVALQVSFATVQAVVVVYLMAATVAMGVAGRLGDRFGRRRVLVAGALVFAAGSLLCAASPGFWLLLTGRMLQGLGAASMTVLSVANVAAVVPKASTGRAMGVLGTVSAVGTALGPAVGGGLLALSGWRLLFGVLVPLTIVAAAVSFRQLPADRTAPASAPAVDLRDLALLVTTLVAVAWALAPHQPLGLRGLCAAVAVAAAVVRRRRAGAVAPFLSSGGVPLLALSGGAAVVMSTLVVGPFHLSGALGLPAAQVGLAMAVGPAVAALSGVPAGRLVDRFGARRMGALGLAGVTAGCLALAASPTAWGVPGYLLPLAVITAHYAVLQSSVMASLMADAPAERRGAVSGRIGLARQLGFLGGASAVGAVFAIAMDQGTAASAASFSVAEATRITFASAGGLLLAGAAVVALWRAARVRRGPREA